MTDPVFHGGQGTNPYSQSSNPQNQNVQIPFGGSHEILENPNIFQASGTPSPESSHEDFGIDFSQLQAGGNYFSDQHEIEMIEPQVQESLDEYMNSQIPPQPEIIEQEIQAGIAYNQGNPDQISNEQNTTVIEPQMKPEVKINPWKQGTIPNQKSASSKTQNKSQTQISKPQMQKQKSVVLESQIKAETKIPPKQGTLNNQSIPSKVQNTPEISNKPQAQIINKTPHQTPQITKTPEIERSAPEQFSDLQKKLHELINVTHNLYALVKKETDQTIELLGAKNDKFTIFYEISLLDHGILIKKIETDIINDVETIHDLGFVIENNRFQVLLDNVLLFDELEHLNEDTKKKMQVTEKLNKFIFLLSEEQKKIEKELKEKEEAEQERKRLQDIFRNF